MREFIAIILFCVLMSGCGSGKIWLNKDYKKNPPDITIKATRPFDLKVKTKDGKITDIEMSTKGKSLFEGMIKPALQNVDKY